jgi:hypothetical protein
MSSTRAGTVDWTGDNPFIYLKTDPEVIGHHSLFIFELRHLIMVVVRLFWCLKIRIS